MFLEPEFRSFCLSTEITCGFFYYFCTKDFGKRCHKMQWLCPRLPSFHVEINVDTWQLSCNQVEESIEGIAIRNVQVLHNRNLSYDLIITGDLSKVLLEQTRYF